ncbi:hypothetical protein TRFO_05066 [Tritrichomonas foetus]|uniref:Uncharacterized protein n=1 Tax=Tritrichomonas foetus TaxID=1144522 RepID=A0A1J4KAL4_9EUKA|nr:hypothetical protein TRFO_05066 [Tritrichomonas foetus]|eukprot:OHT07944.1 hypothetical protein TRFO_05066 [Tritrichomonas foetus]
MENIDNKDFYIADAKSIIEKIANELNEIEKSASNANENSNTKSYYSDIDQPNEKRSKTFHFGQKYIKLNEETQNDESNEHVRKTVDFLRDLTLICWMGGSRLQNEVIFQQNQAFLNRIINYITRSASKGPIIVEILKFFEIIMRDNVEIMSKFLDRKILQNLLNQRTHENEKQMISRWVLKILYISQLYYSNTSANPDVSLEDYRNYIDDYKKIYKQTK